MYDAITKLVLDHRDYDYHLTFNSKYNSFPEYKLTDASLWMPDQNNFEPIFGNPPMPFGCTSYTTADLLSDRTGVLHNPMNIEQITKANEKLGLNVRESLLVGIKNQPNSNLKLFNVTRGNYDWFDSFRVCLSDGNSISIGTPWYREWEFSMKKRESIMRFPLSYNDNSVIWHNHKLCGYKTINGIPYLISKSWQGKDIGDDGFVYFSREAINSVMRIKGTCSFAFAEISDNTIIKTVELPIINSLISRIKRYV